MNEDMVAGEGRDIVGKVKETAGHLTGNRSLQGERLVDQLSGKVQKVIGAAKDVIAADGEPTLDGARRFARVRPYAAAALVGVIGLALINTLRGRR